MYGMTPQKILLASYTAIVLTAVFGALLTLMI